MKNLKNSQMLRVLIFLGLFGFSIGLFDNYRIMWMDANGLATSTISHIISISNIVTVLCLFFFTLKVSTDKLHRGIIIVLILNILTGLSLILLNETSNYFWIKFLMFFNIAFTQLVLSSIYPLMMNMGKDDVLYTKKSFVESLSNKLGFLLVSIILGKSVFSTVIDYNTCLILSLIFAFLGFIVMLTVHIDNKNETRRVDIIDAIKYFNKNKVFYLYFIVSIVGSACWGTVLGMPMLTLTENLHLSSTVASFMILGIGIISNALSMVVVKHLNFKNEYINLFFKYGARGIFYFLTFITGNQLFFLLTIIYMLLTDCLYNFLFGGFFINNIDEKYSLFMTVLKYCTGLIGDSIGVFICGLTFHLSTRLIFLPTLILYIIHITLACILVNKKKLLNKNK